MVMYDSWSRDQMTKAQKEQYQTEPVGESLYTCRTTFRVVCNACGKTLHESTNYPPAYFEQHELVCTV